MIKNENKTNSTGPASRRDFFHLAAIVLTVILLTGLSPACGGGDDGGGGTDTTPCVRFETSAVPGPISVLAQDGEPNDLECNLLLVDLIVHEVDDLFAANFVVTYPSSVVAFNSASGLDSVLASGNTAVDVEARVTNAGEVTIGITRLGANTGVNVGPDGAKLIRLVFVRTGSSGSGDLEFPTGILLDSSAPPVEIPNSQWSGGTIGIIRI